MILGFSHKDDSMIYAPFFGMEDTEPLLWHYTAFEKETSRDYTSLPKFVTLREARLVKLLHPKLEAAL